MSFTFTRVNKCLYLNLDTGAKEPSCVCNWGSQPRECFLAEVQKHPKLMIEAKILEDSIKQKQQIRQEEARISKIVRRDQGKFSALLDRGHEVSFYQELPASDILRHVVPEILEGYRQCRSTTWT